MEKTNKRKILQDYFDKIEDTNLKQIILEILNIEKNSIIKTEKIRSIKRIIEKQKNEN